MKLVMASDVQASATNLARFLLGVQNKVEDIPIGFIAYIYDFHVAHQKEFLHSCWLAQNMDTHQCLENVFNNTFVNPECTWEKLATLYAFAMTFAVNRNKEEVAKITGQYVAQFHLWIESQGGWPKHLGKWAKGYSNCFWIGLVGFSAIFSILLYRQLLK